MESIKKAICEYVDSIAEELIDTSRQIFEHPELKFEEEYASSLLAEKIQAAGFSTQTGVAGLKTAFRADHPAVSDGSNVAIISEYDALPDIGHACGHNLIAAAGLGAALAVGHFKKDLPGKLLYLGTPAEEGGGGKVIMVDAGLFEGVDAAMMFHPSSNTVVNRRSLAISEVMIEFTGKASHASGSPEKGINALDAVIQTFNGLNALRQHIKDGARIHGIITDGGAKPNIVPEHAAANFYVRALENEYRDTLLDKLRACAEGAALATGAKLDFKVVGHSYKAMKPNHVIGDAFVKNLAELGEPLVPPPADAGMGSTDMGDVSQVVPSIHAYIKICEEDTPAHSRGFAQAAISKRGLDVMLIAAKALAMTAVDILSNPKLVEKMWDEFRSS